MERDENVLSFDNSDDDEMENLADEMDFDADDKGLWFFVGQIGLSETYFVAKVKHNFEIFNV